MYNQPMKILKGIVWGFLILLNTLLAGYNYYRARQVDALSYYYCHSEGLGDITLLVRASDVEEADQRLRQYTNWAQIPNVRNICSSVYRPEPVRDEDSK